MLIWLAWAKVNIIYITRLNHIKYASLTLETI